MIGDYIFYCSKLLILQILTVINVAYLLKYSV